MALWSRSLDFSRRVLRLSNLNSLLTIDANIYSCGSSQKFLSTSSTKNEKEHEVISRAMKLYMEKAKQHDDFMEQKQWEYEIGKRHLANMMGENPDNFPQEDVDKAISYLLPSGLFIKEARPAMKPASEAYPKRKEVQFDASGRPYHTLFYTRNPIFFEILQEITNKGRKLDDLSDAMLGQEEELKHIPIVGTRWLTQLEMEALVDEKIPEQEFQLFIASMERLLCHPVAYKIEEFILKYRIKFDVRNVERIPQMLYTDEGRPYVIETGRRKTASAQVTVFGQGTGKFSVNGQNILYFQHEQDKEQIMFPLVFTDLLGKVDIEATVSGGGTTGQSGSIRFAISMALQPFVDDAMQIKMRLAGLLTHDRRIRERKKPGQLGARAKFTWKKR